MDIFFQDPSAVPLPPNEVRIKELSAEPWTDGRRVRVYLEVTPFQKRPSGEINILNAQGEEVASISIIETIDPKMEMTIHLRGSDLLGEYKVEASVFYLEQPEANDEGELEIDLQDRNHIVVDRAETEFKIEKPVSE